MSVPAAGANGRFVCRTSRGMPPPGFQYGRFAVAAVRHHRFFLALRKPIDPLQVYATAHRSFADRLRREMRLEGNMLLAHARCIAQTRRRVGSQ